MRSLKEIAGGIFLALVSIGLIIGSLVLAFSEDSLNASPPAAPQPSSTTIILPSPTLPAPTLPPAPQDATFTPVAVSPTSAATLPAAATNTPWPTATNCVPRADWTLLYTVQPGDTLYRISGLYRVSVAELQRANCLTTTLIHANQKLRVPNVPTSTFTSLPTSLASVTPTRTPTTTPTATPSNTPLPSNTPTPSKTPTNTNTPTFTPFPRTATPTPTP